MKKTLLALLIPFILLGCEKPPEVEEETIRPVKFMQVMDQAGVKERQFPGSLQAKNRVELSFQVSGKLTKLPINEGQKIKKGKMIGELDRRDYQARYDSAVAEYNKAKANYERGLKLIVKEFISQSDLDKLKADTQKANANVRLTRKALADTRLLAPFTGTVAKQYVRNFTDIQAKQAVISFQDNSNIEIVVYIPESIFGKRKQVSKEDIKDLYKLKANISSFNNETFDLQINEYTTEADKVTRTYKITFGIIDTKGYELLPGMTATVFIKPIQEIQTNQTGKSVFNLPSTAVFSDPRGTDQNYVWTINESNQVVLTPVKTGQLINKSIEVLEGISEQDLVVTAGVHTLAENQTIKLLDSMKVQ